MKKRREMKGITKRLQLITWILIVSFGYTTNACKDKETAVTPEVTITKTEITFPNSGGTETLAIQTNVPLEVVSGDESWCTVAIIDSDSKNELVCTITTTANTSQEIRKTTITVLGSGYTSEIKVNQEIEKTNENTIGGDPIAVAKSLGLGWNLGNQLDAHNNGISSETIWGNKATTQEAFNKIAASGIKTVRIPITWLGHIGTAPNYTIEATWMNRVAEVVGYAETAGLKAIINIHHDGSESQYWLNIKTAAISTTTNTQIKAQLKAMWTQIANKFKDKGDFLIFESLNEIHDGGWGWGANTKDGGKQYAVLNEWNQVFVDAVRATGGNNTDRYLGVPGYCTNPDLTINNFKLPTDATANRLMVAVHYYDPYKYTLENAFSEWGHTGNSYKKDTLYTKLGDEEYMKTMFGKLKAKYVDNGIPVYIGEFGCVHRSDARAELFRKYYLEYICKAAKTYGLAPIYWDNGSAGTGKECSGLFNHGTGVYLNNGKDIVDLMVKGITNEDAAYTLESVYNGAPK